MEQDKKAPPKPRAGFEAGAELLRLHLKTMPMQPGVYRMLGKDGAVLYVGKAKDLKKRVASYTQRARLPNRLQRMVAQIRNVEIVTTRTEAEALLLEANFIQRFLPPFNILLRDDKSYPYILITRDHDFPQIAKHRGAKTRKGWYFGPFASSGAVTETLTLLQRGFLLRNCSDAVFANRTRPCLQYHIKRCTAPCVAKVTAEAYAQQVAEARAFLQGKSSEIQQHLATAMQAASEALDFETAARIRDRIKILTAMQARQDINVAGIDDADVVALHQASGKTAVQVFFFRADRNYGARVFFPTHDGEATPGAIMASFLAQFYADKPAPPSLLLSHAPNDLALLEQALSEQAGHKVAIHLPQTGSKKHLVDHARRNAEEALARSLAARAEQTRLLARVADIFHLPAPPQRIEVYDNSHISGTNAVGAMIAAGPEGFLKKTYRKFTIQSAEAAGDDFAMMLEVLTRRFQRLVTEDAARESGLWPDLVLIDGGAGQVNAARAALESLGVQNVALVGIAKGPDRNAGRERFFVPDAEPFSLPPDDLALYYLQRLRDEAHRFAIGTHRARRVKDISRSWLEDIPGIGAARKRALLHHFGSAKAVEGASLDDLTRVSGISRKIAEHIFAFFRRV